MDNASPEPDNRGRQKVARVQPSDYPTQDLENNGRSRPANRVQVSPDRRHSRERQRDYSRDRRRQDDDSSRRNEAGQRRGRQPREQGRRSNYSEENRTRRRDSERGYRDRTPDFVRGHDSRRHRDHEQRDFEQRRSGEYFPIINALMKLTILEQVTERLVRHGTTVVKTFSLLPAEASLSSKYPLHRTLHWTFAAKPASNAQQSSAS